MSCKLTGAIKFDYTRFDSPIAINIQTSKSDDCDKAIDITLREKLSKLFDDSGKVVVNFVSDIDQCEGKLIYQAEK